MIELLAMVLEAKRSQLEIVSGLTNRNKKVLVRDFTPTQLLERLSALLTS